MAMTRAQHNRAIRQEALREQLSNQGHLQHAVEIATKFAQLPKDEQDAHKVKFDMHMRLVNKYLPDIKAVEHTGEGGDPLADFFAQIKNQSPGLPSENA